MAARPFFKTMKTTQKLNIFFKEVIVEMKKVSWLPRKEIIKHTLIVLAVTITVAAFLGGLDYIFTGIIKNVILR